MNFPILDFKNQYTETNQSFEIFPIQVFCSVVLRPVEILQSVTLQWAQRSGARYTLL